MNMPVPTNIFRIIHIDNLKTCLIRQALHSPNHTPSDGLPYRTIHNTQIQTERHSTPIPCGSLGCAHDYIPFYFGPLSPMLLQLKTGQVEGYTEGQEPIIYLVTNAQLVSQSSASIVFSDGHGIAAFTSWYDSLDDLHKVDWSVVYERYWRDTVDDLDRQRRKQAEFLIQKICKWELIQGIAVINSKVKEDVDHILREFPSKLHKPVVIKPEWYYYE